MELIWLIGQHTGLSLAEAAMVEGWKAKYLATWEAHIDGLDPAPGFKEERRSVLVGTFDRLIALCRSQEQDA